MNEIFSKDDKECDFLAGATLLVNKPKDWTSFDVVNKIRYALKRRLGVKKIKVGHAGTLDPLATGLLIICTGKFTKKLNEFQGLPKEYTGTITLGGITASYDLETPVEHNFSTDQLSLEEIEKTRKQFLGELEQVPPIFSALKVKGQPLYKHAREGTSVEIKSRKVQIYEFEFQNIQIPDLEFKAVCSKGTYIRSLAHDFGKALNNGGYLSKLCRTKIGDYSLEDAWKLSELIAYLGSD
ncbi:MAG: tRNA pseudouridine(55) synthase TruB [Bacteroidetes bacterium]|nr:tRNA pseudouridine(55) synthase TruB [Bacteroidota bacterium]